MSGSAFAYTEKKQRKGENQLRLGVVMTGVGAHAAAAAGVLTELERRGVAPYAVCGMQGGAWPAALAAAGWPARDVNRAFEQAAGMGGRLLAPSVWERLRTAGHGMASGTRINRLLNAQTGQRALSFSPCAALFPCRLARNGQRVVFSSRAFMQDSDALLAMQATVSFAARACMALPPFLAPVSYMGSALLAETDVGFAVRQLLALGAQRVLVIAPVPSPQHAPDALDLAGTALRLAGEQPLGEAACVLRMTMPATAGALSFEQMPACCEAGRRAAERELDGVFERMGMAFCRVLPFRRHTI